MKKITLITAVAMIAFTTNSFGQEGATGSSTTTVVSAISIAVGNDLAFGDVTENGSGGTITVLAADGATATGASGALPVSGGVTVTAGSFTVTGEADNVFDITLENATASLEGVTATNVMEVSGLNTSAATGTIGQPSATFYVGGILTLAGGQAIDTYSGTYDVTVQYQ